MQTSLKEPRNYAVSFNKETLKKDIIKTAEEAGFLEQVDFDDLTSHPTTIAGYGITDAYILNGTIYLGNQSITPESVSNLGTAAYADVTSSVSQGSLDLPTSGAVYSAIAAAVSSALHFRGISSTALTDGGTETATIGGVALVPQDGDVVIYDGFEFLWESNQWNKLGDDTSYALKTIQINGDGTYITGGGDLTSSRTLDLSQAVKDALALASTAYQKPSGGIPASDLAEAYLPLTAGSTKALTGNLFLDATSGYRHILWTWMNGNSSVSSSALRLANDGNLYLGYNQITNSKNIYLSGTNLYLTFGTTSRQVVGTGTYFRPATNNDISLGTSTLKWKIVYATQFDGALALSNVTGADDLKAIEALTGTGFAKRTADNTWALTNDIEATSLKTIAESDASFTYRKTPNTAVGDTLKIKRILGNTLVWNQLYSNGDTEVSTTTSTSTVYTQITNKAIDLIANHKYYVAATVDFSNCTNFKQSGFAWAAGTYGNYVIYNWVGAQKGRLSYVATALYTMTHYIKWTCNKNAVDSNAEAISIKDLLVIDLTAMGLDTLTAAEFEALFPLNYYAYNAGSLLSLAATGLVTTGFNQWDEEWEVGMIDNTTGANSASSTRIRAKNYIPVFPSTIYYFLKPAGKLVYLYYYDAEQNFLNYADPFATSGTGGTFTTPTAARYMRFIKAYAEYNNDICINLSDPDKNGTYEPYHKDTLTLNLTSLTSGGVAVCPEGLKAADYAGTVCDETDGQVLKNRVGRINLGDLNFTKSGDTYYVLAFTSAKAPASSYDVANMIPSKFSIVARNSQTTLSDEIALAANGNLFITPSTSYATAADFKTAMNGVYLDYELATPVDYVLDTPIPMLVASDVNGTQKRLPEDTDSSVQAPFRADFQYGVNPDDIIQDLNTKLQDLDNRYLPANALSNVTDITGTGLLTMPRAAISDSLLVPTLCRQQQGDVILEWYEAKASLYVKENDLTLHIVLNGNDYSLNLN